MKATATLDNANIDYTDYAGNCWVIVNGKLRAASAKYAAYRTVTVALAFYSDEDCETPCTALELTEIGGQFDYVTITLDVGANIRLSETQPGSAKAPSGTYTFEEAFDDCLAVDRTVTATITQSTGAVSLNKPTWYVSVNGDGETEAASAHSDGDSAPSAYTVTGSIGVSAVAHTR